MVVSTEPTSAGAARVRTPGLPIGQSELSMSMVCRARKPGGVRVSIGIGLAALACGEREGVQAGARVTSSAAVAVTVSTRDRAERRLASRLGAGNVHDNFEFQQRRASRHRVGPVTGMGFDGGAIRPRLERFIRLPLCHYEIAVLTLYRTQQLKAEEAGLVLHRVRTMGESLLEFGASIGR